MGSTVARASVAIRCQRYLVTPTAIKVSDRSVEAELMGQLASIMRIISRSIDGVIEPT